MYSTSKAILPMGCCWGRKLKGSLRIHDSSTNINIFILLSSLTAPGRPNHAYSINKRHAQCSQVSVSIHTHPQIPWQKLFVLTRACKRDRTEKQTKTQKGERGVKKKKTNRRRTNREKNGAFCSRTRPAAELLRVVWLTAQFSLWKLNLGSIISL